MKKEFRKGKKKIKKRRMAGTTFNNIYRNVIRNEIGKIVI